MRQTQCRVHEQSEYIQGTRDIHLPWTCHNTELLIECVLTIAIESQDCLLRLALRLSAALQGCFELEARDSHVSTRPSKVPRFEGWVRLAIQRSTSAKIVTTTEELLCKASNLARQVPTTVACEVAASSAPYTRLCCPLFAQARRHDFAKMTSTIGVPIKLLNESTVSSRPIQLMAAMRLRKTPIADRLRSRVIKSRLSSRQAKRIAES